eukprot:5597901-Amphidinium_carterae.1
MGSCLGLVMTSYFDDFPSVAFKGMADAAHYAAEQLLGMLGIEFSMKSHKRLPYASDFVMLGVR